MQTATLWHHVEQKYGGFYVVSKAGKKEKSNEATSIHYAKARAADSVIRGCFSHSGRQRKRADGRAERRAEGHDAGGTRWPARARGLSAERHHLPGWKSDRVLGPA